MSSFMLIFGVWVPNRKGRLRVSKHQNDNRVSGTKLLRAVVELFRHFQIVATVRKCESMAFRDRWRVLELVLLAPAGCCPRATTALGCWTLSKRKDRDRKGRDEDNNQCWAERDRHVMSCAAGRFGEPSGDMGYPAFMEYRPTAPSGTGGW